MTTAEGGRTHGNYDGLEGLGQGPAGRQQRRFTSLSTLGAQAPLTPTELPDGARNEWIRQPIDAIKELINLLGPNVVQDDERSRAVVDVSSSDIERRDGLTIESQTTVVNEQTPLLQNNNRIGERTPTSAQNGGKKGKYIGGGCYCDPLGKIITTTTKSTSIGQNESDSVLPNGNALTASRPKDCQMCNGGGFGGACFAYGSIHPPSIFSATATNAELRHKRSPSGMTLAVLAQICFAILSLLAVTLANHQSKKGQAKQFDALQLLIGQSFLMFLVSLITLFASSRGKFNALFGRKGSRIWLWIRALSGSITATLFVLAAQVLPIADILSFVYLAPVVYNFTSHLFFTSRHPFRAQLVSLSLWLGLILMVQPNFMFGNSSQEGNFEEEETVSALPLDLPGLVNAQLLTISVRIGYAAMAGCGLFTLFTMALFDQSILQNSQRKVSIYQTIFASSLITIIIGIPIRCAITKEWNVINFAAFQSAKSILLFISMTVFGFLAKILQDLALNRTGSCQFGLISFLQPLLSTGIDLVFPDLASDILSLVGSLLIIVNLAWIASPLDDDDDEEEREH